MMTTRERLITTAEFEAFIAQAENAERRFELIDGEIVEKPMPTDEHGFVANNIGGEFYIYFRANPIGRATVEGRYRPTGVEHQDRLPDVSIILGDHPLVTQGTADFMPDICIEIQSPDDKLNELRGKMQFYLDNGAKFALLVRPRRRGIEVYPKDGDYEFLTADEMLTFGDLLPGFAVPVTRFFPSTE